MEAILNLNSARNRNSLASRLHTLIANLHSLNVCLCESGLSLESETGLSPVERDTDSHRPLMSDEEDEVEAEVYARQYQQPDEPLAETPQAIGFCQAFCLPGVLPVSPRLPTSQDKFIYKGLLNKPRLNDASTC